MTVTIHGVKRIKSRLTKGSIALTLIIEHDKDEGLEKEVIDLIMLGESEEYFKALHKSIKAINIAEEL